MALWSYLVSKSETNGTEIASFVSADGDPGSCVDHLDS